MKFGDGAELETDIILFSAGIRPRDELARQSGLAIGERGGIVINDCCQTSNPDIYAIGECALWNNKILVWLRPAMTWHVLLRNMYFKKNVPHLLAQT